MATIFVGQTPEFGVAVEGRGSLGIATEEDLAVDPNSNLAVDALADLAVVQAVTWIGISATEAVEFGGGTAVALAQSEE
jgi:hypothetical protein